ncbi:hypothetical protein MRX96_014560 [Rhipicephalus microplus]
MFSTDRLFASQAILTLAIFCSVSSSFPGQPSITVSVCVEDLYAISDMANAIIKVVTITELPLALQKPTASTPIEPRPKYVCRPPITPSFSGHGSSHCGRIPSTHRLLGVKQREVYCTSEK